jgi:hypothetical protein
MSDQTYGWSRDATESRKQKIENAEVPVTRKHRCIKKSGTVKGTLWQDKTTTTIIKHMKT